MVKADAKSAFWNIPMCFHDFQLPGIKCQSKFYIDCCLPFGAAISCAIFEDVANLIQWITENKAAVKFISYLDDFFTCHLKQWICDKIMQKLLEVCVNVGMLMALDKFVVLSQIIEFLGLLLDSILMVIWIPHDKVTELIQMLQTALKACKATVKYLQSLTGKLNFVCKAIPQGHTFLCCLYDASLVLKLHDHVDITGEVHKDLLMWRYFLSSFNRWTSVDTISNDTRKQSDLHIYTDVSANPNLGWGSFAPSSGQSSYGQWPAVWFAQFQPSVDFLELFPVFFI